MLLFENDYSLAWTLYGVAALGCLLVWLRMTRWIWRWLREPLRLFMAVLLLTPTLLDPEKGIYAPAVAITALDMLFHVGDNAWRAVSDLALYGLIALGGYLLFALVRWPFERNRVVQSASKARQVNEADEPRPSVRERLEPRI